MKFPNLTTTQVAILYCDAETGDVLDSKFEIFTNENQNCYTLFDTIELAKQHIEKTIRPLRNVETIVYDSNKNEVFYYTPKKGK